MTGKKKNFSAEKLNAALLAVRRRFGHRPEVTGFDIGYKWNDGQPSSEICVRIHVQKKIPLVELEASKVFPAEINDVPLDVIEGPYRVQRETSSDEHKARSPFLMGGLSCGRTTGETGTIGALVIDQASGAPMILSNWHVMHGASGQIGDPILQPGRADQGLPRLDSIANLGRSILDRDGDAAVAQLTGNRGWLPLIFGSYAQPERARNSRLGETLAKSGRTTGQTLAKVDGEGFYKLRYEVSPGQHEAREIRGFKLVALKQGNPDDIELSSGGDSGSLWYSPSSGDAVGLHFAGEVNDHPAAEFAIACNMTSVLKRLDVRLATFDDLLKSSSQPAVELLMGGENRVGLTPLPPDFGPSVPFPPIDWWPPRIPWPPRWPWPPRGPWPRPYPDWRTQAPTMPNFPGISGTRRSMQSPSVLAERIPQTRAQISITGYIWPALSEALVAKNAVFANADLFSLLADFHFTAGGGQIDLVIRDAAARSDVFSSDGLRFPQRWFYGAPDFWAACVRIAELYPTDQFEIIQ